MEAKMSEADQIRAVAREVVGEVMRQQGVVNPPHPRNYSRKSQQSSSCQGLPETGFLRVHHISLALGIGCSTWWRWVREGKAPPGILLGPRTRVWTAKEIRALYNELAAHDSTE